MKGLGKRQHRIMELLEDNEWWEPSQIRTILVAEGMLSHEGNRVVIYKALRRLEKRGLVESFKPKTFGPPIRLWAKVNGSGS